MVPGYCTLFLISHWGTCIDGKMDGWKYENENASQVRVDELCFRDAT